jgi:hypothetical protein
MSRRWTGDVYAPQPGDVARIRRLYDRRELVPDLAEEAVGSL